MKLPITKFKKLLEGESVSASQLASSVWNDIKKELLVADVHKSHVSYRLKDREAFIFFLKDRFGIEGLDSLEELNAGNILRSDLVRLTGDSKMTKVRTFQGFLVSSYDEVVCILHGKPLKIEPVEGSFVFISDYRDFSIPEDILVVGIENCENFRYLRQQRWLFDRELPGRRCLFVSRYPQTNDLVSWLQMIPNQYVHFGDLDLAGIEIFLSAFKPHLGSRASFLVPSDYRERLEHGNSGLYQDRYRDISSDDSVLQDLIDCINHFHKGYEQEGYIVR